MEFDLSALRSFYDEVYAPSLQDGDKAFLLANTNMSKDYNPQTITERLNHEFGSMCDEIKLNKNGLIPCPGTMQGGVLVKMLS